MKKNAFHLFWLLSVLLYSCSNTTEETTTIQLQWQHSWDQQNVSHADLETTEFQTAHGEYITISRLRYLISRIVLVHSNGEEYAVENPYFLVDISQPETLQISLGNDLPMGTYSALNFTFGFMDADNLDGEYPTLNTANWNVPMMLGGGYHYLQLEGEFRSVNDQPQPFNYHMIRAADRTDPDNLILQETAFRVSLGEFEVSEDATLQVDMQLNEWFQNPYLWDLNQWNTMLMPNFNAQLKMKENGSNVFQYPSL
ncbi:MAG: MbnP family protein [Flavobacteriaceae bacterium]